MYLLTELILFIPLIVYSCIRVRGLLPGLGLKRACVLGYIFLFTGYPAAEWMAHRDSGPWASYLIVSLYYCLPYLLYITLWVPVLDLAILLARAARLLRAETVGEARFGRARLAVYVVIPALIVAGGVWNNNRLQIRTLSVEIPQRSSHLRELHIVFASDFHLSQITKRNLVERFVEKVNSLNPDIVLIGGDMVEGDRDEDLRIFEKQFRSIRSRHGVYAASGNHERFRGGAAEFFARSGMKLIEDGVEQIDDSFYLAVRRNARFSGRKSVTELLEDAPEDLPIILMDHSPTDLDSVSRSLVDLQFSGHTHNGQLFPVNLVVMPFQYELAWGVKKKGHATFIVSSGVQAWGPPVKTAGASEILSVRIRFDGAVRGNPKRP